MLPLFFRYIILFPLSFFSISCFVIQKKKNHSRVCASLACSHDWCWCVTACFPPKASAKENSMWVYVRVKLWKCWIVLLALYNLYCCFSSLFSLARSLFARLLCCLFFFLLRVFHVSTFTQWCLGSWVCVCVCFSIIFPRLLAGSLHHHRQHWMGQQLSSRARFVSQNSAAA